jgi:putative hydrolase of the HAD superfamily
MGKSRIDSYENGTVRGVVCGQRQCRDVYGAQRVGMKPIFFKSNQGRVKPDYIIYNFPELLSAFLFFEESRA